MRDPVTGASKGVGFVSFDNFESSDQAIEAMNGQYLCGKALNVNYSLKKDGKGGEKHGSAAGKNNELSPFFVANFVKRTIIGISGQKASNQNSAIINQSSSMSLINSAFVIGIAGGSFSGKKQVCENIAKALATEQCVVISMRDFYRDSIADDSLNAKANFQIDYDHPNTFDFEKLTRQVGKGITLSIYDMDWIIM